MSKFHNFLNNDLCSTATLATLNVTATAAKASTKKKDLWTERNMTGSGQMATSPSKTTPRRSNQSKNQPPKNELTNLHVYAKYRLLVRLQLTAKVLFKCV